MDTQLGGKAKKNACMYFVMGRKGGKERLHFFARKHFHISQINVLLQGCQYGTFCFCINYG